ncbi:hypothetical protein ACOMHN_034190 [Nucella lapillus]
MKCVDGRGQGDPLCCRQPQCAVRCEAVHLFPCASRPQLTQPVGRCQNLTARPSLKVRGKLGNSVLHVKPNTAGRWGGGAESINFSCGLIKWQQQGRSSPESVCSMQMRAAGSLCGKHLKAGSHADSILYASVKNNGNYEL